MSARGEFSSRIGFVLAAAGSAVGLGNIWGFPTKVAENGGAAFVLMYLVMAFLLAYPVLMAELIIGRAKRANMIDALGSLSSSPVSQLAGKITGSIGLTTVVFILAFYSIVAGWMIAFFIDAATNMLGLNLPWLTTFSELRNLCFMIVFLALTGIVVSGGVSGGIERWSVRLMPTLFIIIVILIIYVSFQDGAMEGWKAYLVPDFSRVLDPGLLIDAMGQAFFSMSLGVGTMLVYGSYIRKEENLPKLGASVALVDIGVAVIAGMLIIPAMYVAANNGVQIFTESGALIQGDSLIFNVLPELFKTIEVVGYLVATAFFALMVIAALTSSISMLEVPVSYLVDNKGFTRNKASLVLTLSVMLISGVIVYNYDALFGLVITLTTEYSQPLLGFALCIFAGWVWRRNDILAELKNGNEQAEQGLFWKLWPWYVRFVCPVIIVSMFVKSLV
ncbi:sodium-dependent transporter [Glaciecola sp. MH2013]|uniref:sodium-dependent transporter n=1 Tax=Glaciecola sp. MH2013 TaxID=2785524 RepID=UPI00189D3186|nr:sodium-dependent transporter [Glaciecola sp. MH2013]MBF7072788.1 sodium-dependent transporter [Glaciecola sp. MH2013]